MSVRKDRFEQLIEDGKTAEAIFYISGIYDYNEMEEFVRTALDSGNPELLEGALEAFLETSKRNNYKPQHDYWVRSLTNFTGRLWERGMFDWIKRFNEIAFRGALEYGDWNHASQLIVDFCYHSKWDDDPADFHITKELAKQLDPKFYSYDMARIKAGKFESEIDCVFFELSNLKHDKWDNGAQCSLIDVEAMQGLIQRLAERGADTARAEGILNGLLRRQLRQQKQRLASTNSIILRDRAEKAIAKTKAALGQ